MSANTVTQEQRGTALGLTAIVVWSFAALLAVELTSIPPFQLFSCQFFLAFLITLVRYSFSSLQQQEQFFNFRWIDLLIAATTLTINQFCYFSAFRYAPPVHVDLITYLWPTLLILFSSLLPKEKLCFAYVLSSLLCLWGLYTLIAPEGVAAGEILLGENGFGYFLALGAAFSWALYSLYSRYRQRSSANCISIATGVAGVVTLSIHLCTEEFVIPTLYECSLILLSGSLLVGLAFYFWECSMKEGKVKVLSLASYAIPLLSVMLLMLFGKATYESHMATATLTITLAPLLPAARAMMRRRAERSVAV